MDTDPTASFEDACRELPVFPLPSVAFFPGTLLPLHVFEPRYRELVRHCMANGRVMGVPQLGEGWRDDYEGAPPLVPMMGVGRIVRCKELADGRFNIILFGLGRACVLEEHTTVEAFRLVRARVVPDAEVPAGPLARAARDLTVLTQSLMPADPLAPSLIEVLEAELPPAPLINTLGHLLLDDPAARQRFLEELDPLARAEAVSTALVTRISSRPIGEA